MIVSELWRYPVKSIRGESCAELNFEPRGVAGDRFFALVNADGKIGSHKTTRRFLAMRGLYDYVAKRVDDEVWVLCPDGQSRAVGDPALDAMFSQSTGQSVRVAAETHVPHMDMGPVHLITTASMRWLANHVSDAQIDSRRFRPNIVIECEGDSQIEQQWFGKTLQIGSVLLTVTEPVERCVMLTAAQEDLAQDHRLLRAVAQLNDKNFGVYARIERIGTVSVKDWVEIVDG